MCVLVDFSIVRYVGVCEREIECLYACRVLYTQMWGSCQKFEHETSYSLSLQLLLLESWKHVKRLSKEKSNHEGGVDWLAKWFKQGHRLAAVILLSDSMLPAVDLDL